MKLRKSISLMMLSVLLALQVSAASLEIQTPASDSANQSLLVDEQVTESGDGIADSGAGDATTDSGSDNQSSDETADTGSDNQSGDQVTDNTNEESSSEEEVPASDDPNEPKLVQEDFSSEILGGESDPSRAAVGPSCLVRISVVGDQVTRVRVPRTLAAARPAAGTAYEGWSVGIESSGGINRAPASCTADGRPEVIGGTAIAGEGCLFGLAPTPGLFNHQALRQDPGTGVWNIRGRLRFRVVEVDGSEFFGNYILRSGNFQHNRDQLPGQFYRYTVTHTDFDGEDPLNAITVQYEWSPGCRP